MCECGVCVSVAYVSEVCVGSGYVCVCLLCVCVGGCEWCMWFVMCVCGVCVCRECGVCCVSLWCVYGMYMWSVYSVCGVCVCGECAV